MTTKLADVDVLIVGAGPVGLFMANECARRNLKYRLIETRAQQSQHSKALAIFPRTMEIFDMAGVVKPFVDAANPVTAVSIITHDRRLAHLPFHPDESPYQYIAMVPQNVTESILADQLHRKGGTVEYETTFVSADQLENQVEVKLDHNGAEENLTAAFVVGCDGAHSKVRHILNLPFEGAQYDDLIMLADIRTNETLPANELQLCPSEFGPVAIFPISGTRRRIVATVEQQTGESPSLELVQEILKQRAPAEIEAYELYWSSFFHIHHRQVATLRSKRMFVAGDAAHIHSPFGGQGMNTGLHDIWNLAWKLDLFLNGHGNEQLLNSYDEERRPVIKQVIETTHFLTRVLGTPNKLTQLLRNAIIPMVSRLAPFQHAFVERMSELGITYDGSPIVEGAGKRFFNDSLRGGTGILDRYLLFVGKDDDSSTVGATQRLHKSFAEILELRKTSGRGVTLVRPDGYVAFEAHRSGEIDAIASLLHRQTDPSASRVSAEGVG